MSNQYSPKTDDPMMQTPMPPQTPMYGSMSAMPLSGVSTEEMFRSVMLRVYGWMALGLLITAVTAVLVTQSEALLRIILSPFMFVLFIGELLVVLAISAGINRISATVAAVLFLLYAFINGLTMTFIFFAYTQSTIWLAFGTTAALFGVLSVIGYTTKEDLSKWRGILMMGLVALIIGSVANLFFANSTVDWILTYAGLLLFIALTVYDTNRIKGMALAAAGRGQVDFVGKVGVLGALILYLDFINLFLRILRIFGRRR